MEKNKTKEQFGNFGLELNKPPKGGGAFGDLTSLEKTSGILTKRFLATEKSKPDLDKFHFDNVFLQKMAERHLRNAKVLATNGLVSCAFTPDWRMVTGMGEASVYETNITLHHVYGIPYIPASTIKGILRHYLEEFVDGKDCIEQIFGKGDDDSSTSKPVRGQCIFFDAFPLKSPKIELDVMTPHYPEYYSKGLPPADWQSPTPIHFLTVGKDTPFRFMIGFTNKSDASTLKPNLTNWLKEALQSRGIGAKTAVGYGYFKEYSQ